MYVLHHHKTMTLEKWSKYPLDRQIFMIANEINRLKNGIRESLSFNDLKDTLERIFELLDLTISASGGSFRHELLRFREIFAALFLLSEEDIRKSFSEVGQFYRVLLFLNSKTSVLNELTPNS